MLDATNFERPHTTSSVAQSVGLNIPDKECGRAATAVFRSRSH